MVFFIHFINAQTHFKPGFGFDFGLGPGGMDALYQTNNPMIKHNASLSNNPLNSGTIGFFLQFMRSRENSSGHAIPGYGIKTKLSFNSFSSESESFVDNEAIVIKTTSIPVLFKVCLSANEVDVSASRSPDSYTLSGNTVYYYPGQYSPGYRTTKSIFLYAGPQYDMINKAKYSYNGSSSDIRSNFVKSSYSFLAGMEIMMGNGSLDFGYQKGLKSVSTVTPININAFFIKFAVTII
jgi:hypothetical protein